MNKRRSRHKRCPVCRKIRYWWMRPNEWHEGRVSYDRLADGQKACWVCVSREMETGAHEFFIWKLEHDKLEVIRPVMNDLV